MIHPEPLELTTFYDDGTPRDSLMTDCHETISNFTVDAARAGLKVIVTAPEVTPMKVGDDA